MIIDALIVFERQHTKCLPQQILKVVVISILRKLPKGIPQLLLISFVRIRITIDFRIPHLSKMQMIIPNKLY